MSAETQKNFDELDVKDLESLSLEESRTYLKQALEAKQQAKENTKKELDEELSFDRLFRYGKNTLDNKTVQQGINQLNEPHRSNIRNYIKKHQIKSLQAYLNELIDKNTIDKKTLENDLNAKWIRLNDGHIQEDWKFWPQTMETITHLPSTSEGWNNNTNIQSEQKDKEKNKWWNSNEKYNYDEPIKWGDKKFYNVKKLWQLSHLPKDYRWDIPKNYKEWDKNTYATVYHVYIQWKSDEPYIFYGNGTCKSPLDGQIYDSKAIVDKLNGGRANEETYWNDLRLHLDQINTLLQWAEVSINWKPNNITAYNSYKKITFTTQGLKYKKTLSAWDLLDKNWNFDDNYFKKVLLPGIKKELESQDKANSIMQWLMQVKKKWYYMNDIFGSAHAWETKYLKYFSTMSPNNKPSPIKFDDIVRDGTNIKFTLDNYGRNKDYNKLTVSYKELADKNGNFSEDALKKYLKKKIPEIIKSNF